MFRKTKFFFKKSEKFNHEKMQKWKNEQKKREKSKMFFKKRIETIFKEGLFPARPRCEDGRWFCSFVWVGLRSLEGLAPGLASLAKRAS